MSTIPDLPDVCWPVNTDHCEDFENHPQDVQDLAVALAGETLRMLTGYSVGGCPVLLRPCSIGCVDGSANWYYSGGSFYPHIDVLGRWVNACGCQHNTCACTALPTVHLSGGIGAVTEVKVDGVVLNPISYRLDNGAALVRLDGEAWPVCQDMALADTEVGTFSVSVVRGAAVDGLGAYAAGVLACEFAKALTGCKCRLPSTATAVTRQGISYEIPPGAFPDGKTGIREVDAYVQRYNPHGLTRPSAVYSPDITSPVVPR